MHRGRGEGRARHPFMNAWTVVLAGLALVLFATTMYLVVVSLGALLRGETKHSTIRLLVAVALVCAGYASLALAAYAGEYRPGAPILKVEDDAAQGRVDVDALKDFKAYLQARSNQEFLDKRVNVRLLVKTVSTAVISAGSAGTPTKVTVIVGSSVNPAGNRAEAGAPVALVVADLGPDNAGIKTGKVLDILGGSAVVANDRTEGNDWALTLGWSVNQAEGGKLVLLVSNPVIHRQ